MAAQVGSFRLILKNLTAIFTSNVISIITELVQPGIFLSRYGMTLYAKWLVLSSAVSYLGTLNFGLQTYVNQDLAIRYNRGERKSFHVQQSTALRALLGTALIAAAGCLVIFVLPIERILSLAPLGHWAAATALYFIALQILMGSLLYGYFGGTFMAVGLAHRGNNWNNAQRLGNGIVLCTLAILRQPFWVLAMGQFLLYCVLLCGLLIDLKRKAPEIFPTLKYWDFEVLKAMLKPSVFFAIQWSGNFLSFELPMILLNKFAGEVPVVIFSLGRKIFSFGRQVLTGLTQSLGPEITRVYGQADWGKLFRIYDYSERVIFALIALVNVPMLVFSPLLLPIFMLHLKSAPPAAILFSLRAYILLAAVAIILCVKEHKTQFQNSTNTHETMARHFFVAYLVMAAVSVPAIIWFGLPGLVATWAVTEAYQTWTTVRLNQRLFAGYERISTAYIGRLGMLSVFGLTVDYLVLHHATAAGWGFVPRAASGLLVVAMMFGLAWFVFQLGQLTRFMKNRLPARLRFGRA